MDEIIDLRELFRIIKRKAKFIILVGIIFALITAVVNVFFITPEYQASTTIIINKENSESENQMYTSDDINYVQKLAFTYSEIITSRAVLGKTINELNLDMSYKKLASSINVTNVTNTQIIKISVQHENPNTTKEICNKIPNIFDQEVKRIMKVSGVEVIDRAVLPSSPVKPQKIKNTIFAGIFGIFIGICIAIIQFLMDTKVKTPSDIKEKLDMPLLGVIPKQ